jgi:hypothetical protein
MVELLIIYVLYINIYICDSKLRDNEIKIGIFIESITGNGIVNHETFTCNSDLLVVYNRSHFFISINSTMSPARDTPN